mgnify:CR=1 FL=1
MSTPDHDRVEPSFGPEIEADQAHSPAGQPENGAGPQSQQSATESEQNRGGQEDVEATERGPFSDAAGSAGGHNEIENLRAQAAESQERYMRAMAEMENVRRRAADDVSKAHKFAIESFAQELISVKDSLEMALNVETPTVESYKEGTEATLRQLSSAFERNKLVEINPLGEKFDPNHHQAISMVPASAMNPPVEPNHVATVLQKGYLINDRVLRPALVTVVES